MNCTVVQIRAALLTAISSCIVLVGLNVASHAQQKPEQLAQQSSDEWLALVDSGKYADSWKESSLLFKAHVSQEQWRNMVGPVRDPLGKVISRKLKSATYSKSMPGAPDGDYVTIQYDSSFEHKKSAVETVTPMLDKDGKWRVSGYYLR